jgi:hypothetical protein
MPGQPRVVLLKPLVTSPLIEVGEFSYYDDPDDPMACETRNVLYHYGPERLVIGRFCALGAVGQGQVCFLSVGLVSGCDARDRRDGQPVVGLRPRCGGTARAGCRRRGRGPAGSRAGGARPIPGGVRRRDRRSGEARRGGVRRARRGRAQWPAARRARRSRVSNWAICLAGSAVLGAGAVRPGGRLVCGSDTRRWRSDSIRRASAIRRWDRRRWQRRRSRSE